ncbi:hypothetical protein OPU71_01900 [Niveibacterium sp. 24ML]|uniref:type IV pilus assembly protein FimV n=1 Tax=Niveibacterium sp. 24ML TaxID=2985512 RepID=UPI00226EF7D1|nr:hypothetical protein [Niveibacterium sp. 24ML]MCX9154872.1 hypothetical protein [Niveibacterium sp. 24ML]
MHAAGLGDARVSSHLGQPLRVEIALVGDDASELGQECFRSYIPSAANDDLPWVRDAITRVEHIGPDKARLVVSTRYAVHEPAIVLGMQIGCGTQIRREFTLLLAPVATVEPPRTTDASANESPRQSRKAGAREGDAWSTAEGESAASIARALAAGDRRLQAQITRDIISANPDVYGGASDAAKRALPAGTRLIVPSDLTLRTQPSADPQRPADAKQDTATPQALAPTARRGTTSTRPPKDRPTSADRLSVTADQGDRPLRLSLELDESRRHAVPDDSTRVRLQREQQLILAIDDKIATTLELNDRIRQLEAAQQALQAENARLTRLIASQTAAPIQSEPASTTQDWRWFAAAAMIPLLAFGAWFAWRRRRIQVQPVTPLPGAANLAEDEEVEFEAEPLTVSDIWPDSQGAPQAESGARDAIDWSPPTLSPDALGPSSLLHIDDEVEEHDSAVELAEIMMSFGRVQGAAETLAEFIRANPKQAVKPWIKLLEVYKAASMRMEFDALAGQLNKTFNVKAVTWDEFDTVKAANESIEQMPHVLSRIEQSWGTRECQSLLHTLLRDNRKGTRQGFPLGIVDDILCLNGVLEIELGPFRPSPAELLAMENPPAPHHMPPIIIEDAVDRAATPEPETEPAAPPPLPPLDAIFTVDNDALPPSKPRPAPAPFVPERTESMIEFNLDEELPPLKARD